MRIKLHTVAAVVVLVAAGAWVATGKYSFVGSEIGENGGAAAAEAPAEAPSEPAAVAEAEPAADDLQTVAFVVAAPAPHDRSIRLSGQTEADKQVTLVARTSGAVAELPVTEGDLVEAGGVIMALDGPEKYAAVEAAEAQYQSAVSQAESNQQLRSRGTLPELQLEASIAAREAARSALEAARAEVDRLEIRAPFSGIVDQVHIEVGSWVQPGTEVASLLALDPIVVVGEVNERDLAAVSAGTPATVTFGDGSTADGEVRYVRREWRPARPAPSRSRSRSRIPDRRFLAGHVGRDHARRADRAGGGPAALGDHAGRGRRARRAGADRGRYRQVRAGHADRRHAAGACCWRASRRARGSSCRARRWSATASASPRSRPGRARPPRAEPN